MVFEFIKHQKLFIFKLSLEPQNLFSLKPQNMQSNHSHPHNVISKQANRPHFNTESSHSDQIINSSKNLMSIRLIEIQNQILQRFDQYPQQSKHMLKQMLFRNIDSLQTLQEKIIFLLSVLENQDLTRLKVYDRQSSQKHKLISHSDCLCHAHWTQSSHQPSNSPTLINQKNQNQNLTFTQIPNHISSAINLHSTSQPSNPSPKNQQKSSLKHSKNLTYHESPTLHKYNSQGTLDTVFTNESLYSSVINSQHSEDLKNFIELQRKRKTQAKERRVSNLIEAGKISQQLKLLKMTKKLTKYENRVNPPGNNSLRQIDDRRQSQKIQELNEGKYQLKDQFSFRKGNYDQKIPSLPKTYSQKQFRMHQNRTLNEFDQNQSMAQKTSLNCDFQEDYKSIKSSGNYYAGQNDQSYETNLKKLQKLRNEKFEKQKNDIISTINLDQRISSLFRDKDRQGKNINQNKFGKDNYESELTYQGQNVSNQNTPRRQIFYSQSDQSSIHAEQEQSQDPDQCSKTASRNKTGSSGSPDNKQASFKKKYHKQPFYSSILAKQNHDKNLNKSIKASSKSSLSRSLSSKSKTKQLHKSEKSATNKQRELIRKRIQQENKLGWVRKDGDLGDFQLDLSQFSEQVKQYFVKRRKVLPSIIPSISYRKQGSNQDQLFQRKNLQKAREYEVQQKIAQKCNTLQMLRRKIDEMDQ